MGIILSLQGEFDISVIALILIVIYGAPFAAIPGALFGYFVYFHRHNPPKTLHLIAAATLVGALGATIFALLDVLSRFSASSQYAENGMRFLRSVMSAVRPVFIPALFAAIACGLSWASLFKRRNNA